MQVYREVISQIRKIDLTSSDSLTIESRVRDNRRSRAVDKISMSVDFEVALSTATIAEKVSH